MKLAEVDEALPLLETPSVQVVPPPVGRLVLARRAQEGAFLLETPVGQAQGRQRGALTQLLLGSQTVLGDMIVDAGVVANLVMTPGLMCRERLGSATILESTLVASTLPVAAVQWKSDASAPASLRFEVLPGVGAVRYRMGSSSLTASAGAGKDLVWVGLDPMPRGWRVTPSPSGGLSVEAHPDPTSPVTTLLLATGPTDRLRTAMAASRHLAAHASQASGDPSHTSLQLVTGVPEIDDAVDWARARLHSALRRTESYPPSSSAALALLWSGLGALAVSDGIAARAALGHLEFMGIRGGWAASCLAGRIALTLGDPRHAARHARDALAGSAPDSGFPELKALALSTLADGLRYAATEETLSALREAASRAGSGGLGRALPALGRPASGSVSLAPWLAAALGGMRPGAAVPSELPGLEGPLATWADAATNTDAAWASWRAQGVAALDGGASSGPGTWDDPTTAAQGGAPSAAIFLCSLAHGFLGIVADAPVGRIRLAPRLPDHLKRFKADGIVLGDGHVSLELEREPGIHRFTLRPMGGRVPPYVVFEPAVPSPVVGVRIDGADAELDVHPEVGSRSVARVQVPVDATRIVEIFTA